MSSVLKITDLSKSYGKVKVFKNISFSLEKGESLGLYGISGCGKTTLGKCIIKLEKPTSGKIFFNGLDLEMVSNKTFQSIRPMLQMIFQRPESSFNPKKKLIYSVTEPLVYHEKRSPMEVFQSLHSLIESVNLKQDIFFKYPHQLSGGELQRAMIVRIYSLSPDLIIADEPTSMLDVSVQAQVFMLIKKIQDVKKNSLILISHDPDVIKAVCKEVVVLEEGNLIHMNIYQFSTYIDKMRDKFF